MMFNVGVAFIAFGAMLLLNDAYFKFQARKLNKAQATIIGYKQFPNDEIITTNDIHRGRNFNWLRVVEFSDPQTGKIVQLYSNPGVANPEPIGTNLKIAFDPNKTDPTRDAAIVLGVTAWKIIGEISVITGVVLFVVLLFIPVTSPLHFVGALVGFTIVFIASSIRIWHRPNQ